MFDNEQLWFGVRTHGEEVIVTIYVATFTEDEPRILKRFKELWGQMAVENLLRTIAEEFPETENIIYILHRLFSGYPSVGIIATGKDSNHGHSISIVLGKEPSTGE